MEGRERKTEGRREGERKGRKGVVESNLTTK